MEVFGQVVGRFGHSGTDDEPQPGPADSFDPAPSIALRFSADSMLASAATTLSATAWRCCSARVTGMMVFVLALPPSKQAIFQREPDLVDQKTDQRTSHWTTG